MLDPPLHKPPHHSALFARLKRCSISLLRCAARPQDGGLGLPLKTLQVRMGHSTLAMTADTYGHLFPSQDDAGVLAAGEAALMRA